MCAAYLVIQLLFFINITMKITSIVVFVVFKCHKGNTENFCSSLIYRYLK